MRCPSSPAQGGSSKPGSSLCSFTHFTNRCAIVTFLHSPADGLYLPHSYYTGKPIISRSCRRRLCDGSREITETTQRSRPAASYFLHSVLFLAANFQFHFLALEK